MNNWHYKKDQQKKKENNINVMAQCATIVTQGDISHGNARYLRRTEETTTRRAARRILEGDWRNKVTAIENQLGGV